MSNIRVTADVAPFEIPVRTIRFSGGELQPRLVDLPATAEIVTVDARVWSSEDLLEAALITNAVRHRYPGAVLRLRCPYLPYARQDRVCFPGEAFSLEVMAGFLNSLDLDEIEVWDVHSDVASSLIEHLNNVSAAHFVRRLDLSSDRTVIVAPDTGAVTRATKCAEALYCSLVKAEKTRDPSTGALGDPIVQSDHIGNRDFLIVDDICDGGRTFVNLARMLRPLTNGAVMLYVTHGIFSNGLGDLRGVLNRVYVANAHPGAPNNPLIRRII